MPVETGSAAVSVQSEVSARKRKAQLQCRCLIATSQLAVAGRRVDECKPFHIQMARRQFIPHHLAKHYYHNTNDSVRLMGPTLIFHKENGTTKQKWKGMVEDGA